MQEVYRVISRDYKDNYDYFTKDKELFDLFNNGDGVSTPYLSSELAARYGLEEGDNAWEAFWTEDSVNPSFPYVLLGGTTQYMT